MNSASQDALPSMAPSARYRVAYATVIVAALHLALAAFFLTKRERIPVVAPQSHVITAELLQSAPVAPATPIQSMPAVAPKPVPVVTRVKPEKRSEPKPGPAPAPVPATPVPPHQQVQIQTPAASPLSPVASATASAPSVAPASATPSTGKPVMALSTPRNVSHLDCRIVAPDYPTRSKRLGETGTAYVRFVVGLTGQIEDIELKKSSGFDRLDAAALDAMRASACKPYLENGVPVRAAYTQPFDFALGD
ncbi:protein TonB [Paraburkholderia sp. 32]